MVWVVNTTPRALFPSGKGHSKLCIGRWVGTTTGLDGCRKSHPTKGFDSWTFQAVASSYTDWAIRPPTQCPTVPSAHRVNTHKPIDSVFGTTEFKLYTIIYCLIRVWNFEKRELRRGGRGRNRSLNKLQWVDVHGVYFSLVGRCEAMTMNWSQKRWCDKHT